MSIINDALKKALQEQKAKVPPQEDVQQKSAAETPVKEVKASDDAAKNIEAESLSYSKTKAVVRGGSVAVVSRRHYIFLFPGIAIIVALGTYLGLRYTTVSPPAAVSQPQQPAEAEVKSLSKPLQGLSLPQAPDKEQRLPSDTSEFSLTGIVHGEGAPMAIIDGAVYVVGDSVKKAKVVEIYEDAVTLEKNGQKITLKVK